MDGYLHLEIHCLEFCLKGKNNSYEKYQNWFKYLQKDESLCTVLQLKHLQREKITD